MTPSQGARPGPAKIVGLLILMGLASLLPLATAALTNGTAAAGRGP